MNQSRTNRMPALLDVRRTYSASADSAMRSSRTCAPVLRIGYAACELSCADAAVDRVYDARGADPRDARPNARRGARSRAGAGGHLPGRGRPPAPGSTRTARGPAGRGRGCWGSRPPRPTSWSRHPGGGRDARRRRGAVRAQELRARSWPTTVDRPRRRRRPAPVPAPRDAAGRRARPRRRTARGRGRGDLARSPRRASRRAVICAVGERRAGGDRPRQARRRRAELRERRRPAVRARRRRTRRAGRGGARGGGRRSARSPSRPPKASRSASTRRSGPAAAPAL